MKVVKPEPWFEIVSTNFGIPRDTFDGLSLYQPNKKMLYIVNQGQIPPETPQPDCVGMAFLRINMVTPKMTTGAAMAFGHAATRNIVLLTAEQAQKFLARELFSVEPHQCLDCTYRSHVIIRFEDSCLGIGFLQSSSNDDKLQVRSMFPKAWSINHDCDMLGI